MASSAKTTEMKRKNTYTSSTNPRQKCNIAYDLVEAILAESTCDSTFAVSNLEIIKAMDQSNLNAVLVAKAKRTNSNFSHSRLISRFRCNPSGFIALLRAEQDTAVSDFMRGMKEWFRMDCISPNEIAQCVSVIRELMESHLIGIRFASICFTICLVDEFRGFRSFMNALSSLVDSTISRLRDTSDMVRGLVGFSFVLSLEPEVGFLSDDLVCSAVDGLLADPSRNIRFRMLDVLTKESRKERSKSRLAMLSDRLGPCVVRRCFDREESIATVAIHLLSDLKHGEAFLKDYEKAFEDVSNLVWLNKCDGSVLSNPSRTWLKSDPFRVSRGAIVFVNNHIMASPDLLSKGLTASGLATAVEFILQYSDGHIPVPTFNFISTLMSYFAANKKPFRLDGLILARYMEGLIQEALVEHPSVDSRMTVCGRLGVCLHILFSILRISPANGFSDQGIAALVDLIRDIVLSESLARVYECATEHYPGLNILESIDHIAQGMVTLTGCGSNFCRYLEDGSPGFEKQRKQFWSEFSRNCHVN